MRELAGTLLGVGVMLVLAGLWLWSGATWRLPGDVVWRRGNFTLFAPFGTMLALSLLLTLLGLVLRRR
ncbi:MAG: DUF2905 domain-containing protein [Bacillota bacterium]